MRKARVRRKGAGGKLREGMVGALWMAREGTGGHEITGGRGSALEGARGRGGCKKGAGKCNILQKQGASRYKKMREGARRCRKVLRNMQFN